MMPTTPSKTPSLFHVEQKYDVLVVGGGHAGLEAALASARMGVSTLMITMNPDKIGEMPCNPSIGGVGKGQLVKEIDALGGQMGITADETGIQFKRLNTRKGSAVQSSRCQSDKKLYAEKMQSVVAETPGLDVLQGEVKAFLVEEGQVKGLEVLSSDQTQRIEAKSIVLTAGTFMSAIMHCGEKTQEGGRIGEAPSKGLSDSLVSLGLKLLRLKTGTPARLLASSIDFSKMMEQKGDPIPKRFSFSPTSIELPQISCYLGYTNPRTHQVIHQNLSRSPLYSGMIQGIGPRYCPSIEDKVMKFAGKDRHQVFFEPISLTSDWIYPNGISTSLPSDVQEEFIRSIVGCEEVEIVRYGYAVEYDCIDPTQLDRTLEVKTVGGLYFAGQINGTSGYEEAAAQGLMAGINAALRAKGEKPLSLSRSESYIGVMIDDLTSKGVSEPYRMFTSRAEYRLSLREDNADLRLRPYGRALGLISDEQWERFEERKADIAQALHYMPKKFLKPTAEIQNKLESFGAKPLGRPDNLLQLLKRPELSLSQVNEIASGMFHVEHCPENAETIEIEAKFEGYIKLQQEEIHRFKKLEQTPIPKDFDYSLLGGLSFEAREKLESMKPRTLGEASKMAGITPASMTSIMIGMRKWEKSHANRL